MQQQSGKGIAYGFQEGSAVNSTSEVWDGGGSAGVLTLFAASAELTMSLGIVD